MTPFTCPGAISRRTNWAGPNVSQLLTLYPPPVIYLYTSIASAYRHSGAGAFAIRGCTRATFPNLANESAHTDLTASTCWGVREWVTATKILTRSVGVDRCV